MSDLANLQDLLSIYYARLFPYQEYVEWLSYGNLNTLSKREFSFTIQDDIYIRYKSFDSRKKLETEIRRILPFKIDIGAIYSESPSLEKRNTNMKVIERELVFDIDMTDYDEVRTCCTGAAICNKCWKYMALACKILDTALREDFGFNHLLWVFSGRRGIHCWVCDPLARSLDGFVRGSVAEYLQLISGGEFNSKKVNLTDELLHPSIERAIGIIEQNFVPMCVEEQDMLGNEKAIDKFLAYMPDDESRNAVKDLFLHESNSVNRWKAFLNYYRTQRESNKSKWRLQSHLIEEIMIHYSYPRLDIHVSKGMNHLLKSPYCVHPKTGKVCVPFNPKTVDKFDPMTVPTIEDLIDEINAFDEKDKAQQADVDEANTKKIKDYKKTSLNKSLHVFLEFLSHLKVTNKKPEHTVKSLDF